MKKLFYTIALLVLMGCSPMKSSSPLFSISKFFGEYTCRVVTHEASHADWALRHSNLFRWSEMTIHRENGVVVGGELKDFEVLIGKNALYQDKVNAVALFYAGEAGDIALNGEKTIGSEIDKAEACRVAKFLSQNYSRILYDARAAAQDVHPLTITALAKALFWEYNETVSFDEASRVFNAVKE